MSIRRVGRMLDVIRAHHRRERGGVALVDQIKKALDDVLVTLKSRLCGAVCRPSDCEQQKTDNDRRPHRRAPLTETEDSRRWTHHHLRAERLFVSRAHPLARDSV